MSFLSSAFRHETRHRSDEAQRIYARYRIAHTLVDFSAAACFLLGSIMMFWDSMMLASTWLFVIGSVLFAAKPTITLLRELKLYRLYEFGKLDADAG